MTDFSEITEWLTEFIDDYDVTDSGRYFLQAVLDLLYELYDQLERESERADRYEMQIHNIHEDY